MKIKYTHEEQFDKETGQPLFKPKVGRPPLVKKENNNIPVTDKLYYDRFERDASNNSKRGKLKKSILSIETQNSQMKSHRVVNEKSEQILDQKKARKFHYIFTLLDSDNDGIISAEKIDISQLSPDILEIFTPLF